MAVKGKPRILIIENSLDFTGGLNSVLRSSEQLRDRFDFCFLLPSTSQSIRYLKEKGFVVYELPMKEIRKTAGSMLVYFPFLFINSIRLSNLVKKTGIELIVSNDFYNLMPLLYRLIGGDVPYFCYVRFLPSRFPTWLVRGWFSLHARHARKIFAVSEKVKSELPPHPKVVVLYDGMVSEKTNVTWNENSRTILYLANYIPGKGQQYALQSFAHIQNEFPDWILRFVGGDMGLEKNRQFRQTLVELSKNLGCERQIEWCNFSQDIRQEFEHAAIVLNFSDSESFSLTTLEALFYGRPVIATDSGGPSEIIDRDESGIIIPTGNISSMAGAMRRLMSDPRERHRMGSFGRQRVVERFGYEQTFERLRDHYESVLE